MKNIEKGMSVKQVKPIGKFDYADRIFEIEDINDNNISIYCEGLGTGVLDRDTFDEHFEVIVPITNLNKSGLNVIIVNGIFEGIKGRVCENQLRNFTVVDVMTDDGNVLIIPTKDLEVLSYYEKIRKDFDDRIHWDETFNVRIKIRGKRTTVFLKDKNVSASVYCHKDDEYVENIGIQKAFEKALSKFFAQRVTTV